jgi:hypothetical protein
MLEKPIKLGQLTGVLQSGHLFDVAFYFVLHLGGKRFEVGVSESRSLSSSYSFQIFSNK